MNFEILCFGLENLNEIVHKEYTMTYAEARAFEIAEQDNYSCISITPMNEEAEHEMACVQCGGKYGPEACRTCKHNRRIIMKRYNLCKNDCNDLKVICKSDGETAYCNALAVNGLCKCDDHLCKNAIAVIYKDKYGNTKYLALED